MAPTKVITSYYNLGTFHLKTAKYLILCIGKSDFRWVTQGLNKIFNSDFST